MTSATTRSITAMLLPGMAGDGADGTDGAAGMAGARTTVVGMAGDGMDGTTLGGVRAMLGVLVTGGIPQMPTEVLSEAMWLMVAHAAPERAMGPIGIPIALRVHSVRV